MTPEDEEFMEADSILQQAPIPRLLPDAPTEMIQNLVNNNDQDENSSCVFYHGDLLSVIELMKIPFTPISLFIQSYGVSSYDMGSGRGVWDGSIIFGSWLCSNFENDKKQLFPNHDNMKVIELGAGCSGVPGICIAHAYPNASVVLTDAQTVLIRGLEQNIKLNQSSINNLSAQLVDWNHHDQSNFKIELWNNNTSNNTNTLDVRADVIIGAELLWAGCDPIPLIKTINKLLNPQNGVAYILMPQGGRGIEILFLETCKLLGFHVETVILGPLDSWNGISVETLGDDTIPPLSQLNLNQQEGVEIFQVHILRFTTTINT